MDSQDMTDAEISSIEATRTQEEGLSVPMSKFNTERFGALSVHSYSAPASNFGNATGSGKYRYCDVHPPSQDDEFDNNGNAEKSKFGVDGDFAVDDIPRDTAQGHSLLSGSRASNVSDSNKRLQKKVSELEELLRAKDAELVAKNDEVRGFKQLLHTLQSRDHSPKGNSSSQFEDMEMGHDIDTETRFSASCGVNSPPFMMEPKPAAKSGLLQDNFKPSQSSMPKRRSLGSKPPSFDKPMSVPLLTAKNTRATRPVFGFNSDIPTQSPEETIRDSLFATREFDFGLPQLRTIDPDEEQHAPIKGSKKFNDNLHLGAVTQGCYKSVLCLVQKVSARTRGQALRHTSRLLQTSLILEKPLHALNALKILRILMMTYEDVSVEVSKGFIPSLEHDNEDAWDVVPSETSLPSALACIAYLLVTRLARNPPVKEAIGGVAYSLKEEVENLFQLEIIQVLHFVAWSQLEAMQLARTFVPLIRKGVFEEVIRFQAAKNNLQKVRLMFNILDFVSREVECCKLLMGWRVSQLAWSSDFGFMNTIIGLLGAEAGSKEKLANGVVPRIKITILDIIHRCLCVDLEQTNRMIADTKLMRTLVHTLSDLEEVAEEIHHQRALVSMFRSKGPEGGFTTNFMENRSHPLLKKPLLMTSMGLGNLSKPLKATGTEEGVSPLASVPLNPYDKIFDYLVVMKLGMEMILNILRAFPDGIKIYFGRRPSEKHSLIFTVSKIVARDLGLATAAQNLARDILYDLVPDEETEQEFLELAKD